MKDGNHAVESLLCAGSFVCGAFNPTAGCGFPHPGGEEAEARQGQMACLGSLGDVRQGWMGAPDACSHRGSVCLLSATEADRGFTSLWKDLRRVQLQAWFAQDVKRRFKGQPRIRSCGTALSSPS